MFVGKIRSYLAYPSRGKMTESAGAAEKKEIVTVVNTRRAHHVIKSGMTSMQNARAKNEGSRLMIRPQQARVRKVVTIELLL